MDVLIRLKDLGISPRSLTIGSVSIELSPEALNREQNGGSSNQRNNPKPSSYVEKALIQGHQITPRENVRRTR